MLELEIAQETVIGHSMTLTCAKLTFHLRLSKEYLGNLSDVALSTLFRNPFGSFLVDFCQIDPLP